MVWAQCIGARRHALERIAVNALQSRVCAARNEND
jgi:hypothetical protein